MQIARRPWLRRAAEGTMEHRRRLTRRRLSNPLTRFARHRGRPIPEDWAGDGGALSFMAVSRAQISS